MDAKCLRCKGCGFCGKEYCPLAMRSNSARKIMEIRPGSSFQGTSPAPFIGRVGYPHVNIGILSPPEQRDDAWLFDAPRYWSDKGFGIADVLGYRGSLMNTRAKADIRSGRFFDIVRQIGMSGAPVDIELAIEDRPRLAMKGDSVMAPHGPSANLRSARITENPRIHPKVDRIVSDTDLGAEDGMAYLQSHGFDENTISKLLSVGALGFGPQRRMVPTRWSITASDDTLSRSLVNELKDLPVIDTHMSFYGSYLGNHYLVMLYPDVWGYELFETAGQGFCTDHEGYNGRKSYASGCAGGYYSVRLALAEKMKRQKRQAMSVVIRVITPDYDIPLGVWVTREAARKALGAEPIEFGSGILMERYAVSLCMKKFGIDISGLLGKSVLLKRLKEQRKLSQTFFK